MNSKCYEFYRSNLDTRPIDAGAELQFGESVIHDDKDQENYYQLTVFQKNGTIFYKIYVDRDDTKIMGYVVQIEKNRKILERYSKTFFKDHKIDESSIDFETYYKHLYNSFLLLDD
ncbi:hypothetical protein SAMN04487765_3577 [Tenacibaculum sp. MAR_2010_89]|uniref:hypothetical protein n=1 Tax=Tenacibaculum sp. MAR_2010_89 TaxID=1250198 RepID=UPI00089BFC47|nr:hypothetical protein [Tenacibaculum sp. MAR_2010_89]SEE64758.1 hypothetical protein SAMN04487765_3577 [Tenacibaculum sp. MAR_2010_89]